MLAGQYSDALSSGLW